VYVVRHDACPDPALTATAAHPGTTAPLAANATVPESGAGVTVAVYVTAWDGPEGFLEELRLVVVGDGGGVVAIWNAET